MEGSDESSEAKTKKARLGDNLDENELTSPISGDRIGLNSVRTPRAKIWSTWSQTLGDGGIQKVECLCGLQYDFDRKNGSSQLLKHSRKCQLTLDYFASIGDTDPFPSKDATEETATIHRPAPQPKKTPKKEKKQPPQPTIQHLISVKDLTVAFIQDLMSKADKMKKLVASSGGDNRLKHRILASVFYEPSTRTSCSFQAAMLRLGGSVIAINEQNSSAQKGETLEDTIQTVSSYCDIVVLRHPTIGSAAKAAEVSSKPILNAGDGVGEHPTQALLDLYTIKSELGFFDGKESSRGEVIITLVGDLKHGRTVHSLVTLLGKFGNVRLIYCSPPELAMPSAIVEEISALGISQEIMELEQAIAITDVLYVTRIQKERFESLEYYQAVQGSYCIDKTVMEKAKAKMIVMHPLPRVGEIAVEVDSDPRAAYFRQMENGMYVRMAILDHYLKSSSSPQTKKVEQVATSTVIDTVIDGEATSL